MGIVVFLSILVVILAISVIFLISKQQNVVSLNNQTIEENKELDRIRANLVDSKRQLEKDISNLEEILNNNIKHQKEISQNAFENYCEILDNCYKEKEEEYDILIKNMENAYSNLQMKLNAEAAKVQNDLDKVRATRDAAVEAHRKEKEIKEQSSFYCLSPSKNDLDDIKKLDRIKDDLHNPRILSMLIWSTFFQKDMTSLCNNILGPNVITGIYKITNQKTDECYIGQSVDVAKRWKDHAKCGLGIDTPDKNKLYKSMMEDGIWNFSWELLEECPRADLNNKERFYIDLYKSYDYGFNSNVGIK